MSAWWLVPAFVLGGVLGFMLGGSAVRFARDAYVGALGVLLFEVTEVRKQTYDGRIDPSFIMDRLAKIRTEMEKGG